MCKWCKEEAPLFIPGYGEQLKVYITGNKLVHEFPNIKYTTVIRNCPKCGKRLV